MHKKKPLRTSEHILCNYGLLNLNKPFMKNSKVNYIVLVKS